MKLNVYNSTYIHSDQKDEVQYAYNGNLEETKTQASTVLIVDKNYLKNSCTDLKCTEGRIFKNSNYYSLKPCHFCTYTRAHTHRVDS